MTNTPITPDREQEIRTLDLLELMSDRAAPVISGHLAVLLAEVDRLRARVAELEAAPVDEAAEFAEGQAGLDAMRREHPAPCRVPDSPDCTCPVTAEQARRIERDHPETDTAHDCGIPLVRRLDCGHCPHEICQDCDRCPHTCRCASPA